VKPVVLVLQEQIPPYRVPFFRFLANEMDRRDLDLRVLSSSALPGLDELGFGHQRAPVATGGLSALGAIHRQRPLALILPHSSRFAPVAAATRLQQRRGRKQLLWGMGMARRYGIALPDDSPPASEAIRRSMLSACDHYLSYTEISTRSLFKVGYEATRITTLNNAVEQIAAPEEAMNAQRVPGQMLFVASLVEDKEPLAAVAIADRLRSIAQGTTLHIVGDGPLRNQCEQAASSREWVDYHGTQRGPQLRDLALSSDMAIIPGRVGLAILEMASAGLPMATSAASLHGAEIAYLKDGVNGVFLDRNINLAAKEIAALLTDRPAVERMRNEAIGTARMHTVQDMAANFSAGVAMCLGS
jgi:glycosyltransferase involved in cell wall biosynthesis